MGVEQENGTPTEVVPASEQVYMVSIFIFCFGVVG